MFLLLKYQICLFAGELELKSKIELTLVLDGIYLNLNQKSQMENLINRITINPEICNGRPIIRGMRITVSTILDFLAAGETNEKILNAYPILEKEDIMACLEFARRIADKSILSYELKAS